MTDDNKWFDNGSGTVLRTHRKVQHREELSPASIRQLSEIRRGTFESAVLKKNGQPTPRSSVVGVGLNKNANIHSLREGPGSVSTLMPEIYSPLFQVANMNLPRDRRTMNAWNRHFFDTNPIVRNAITLHATYPISKINVKCKHRHVEQFFNDMADRIDLFDVIGQVAYEYFKIGEAFPYATLDENNGVWKEIVLQNPDYVTVKKAMASNTTVISLRPDEVMRKIVMSSRPGDARLLAGIPDNIIHHIRKNEAIPLDGFNISHLKMLSSPYDTRGTSMIVSCYKSLMLGDKLFECKLAQADSMINPMTIVSVGGSTEGEHHPQGHDLDLYKEMFEMAGNDKDFKLITHASVKVERVGASGSIVDTTNDFNMIRENLYAGLMVPKAVMDTEGSSYASASVGLEVLRTRYINFRNILEKWLEKKIFAPISRIQGFFEYKDGEKHLIVPEIDWNHINLYDLNDYIQALGTYVSEGKVSVHTLYRSLGLNWEEEQRLIREEMVRAAIMAKEGAELQKMSLAELRALDADEQIVEDEDGGEDLLPGQVSGAPEGEGTPDMSMMPDMGAVPDLGAPTGVPPADLGTPPAPEAPAPAAPTPGAPPKE